ncbi:hypothetical protein ACFLZV_03360 [Candidatus Margulisiibacteriota bacterium]
MKKVYEVKMVLGVETDTLDSYGRVINFNPNLQSDNPYSVEDVTRVLDSFKGEQAQVPPQFSAKNINGKRAYSLARQGKEVELKPVSITIYDIDNIKVSLFSLPFISFKLICSKGTYIRSMVRDLATRLGTVAYTKDLVRLKIGEYSISSAIDYDDLGIESIKAGVFSD